MNSLSAFAGLETWHIAGWTMLHFLWLGALVGVLAIVARLLLRRAAANLRYAVALCCLILLVALPFGIASWLIPDSPPLIQDTQQVATTEHIYPEIIELNPQTASSIELDSPASRGVPAPVLPTPTLQKPAISFATLEACVPHLPWLWIIGTPITFALLATGIIGTKRLRHASRPLHDGPITKRLASLASSHRITKRVTVALCERITSPVLIGIVRPIILLPPAALSGWSPDEIEMVLLHELAHVRRWDNLVNLLQRLIESLLFFHPAVWLISTWVRRERESCCDAFVVRRTERPHAYAELLLSLASPQPLAGLAFASHPLRNRIRRILQLEDDPMLISGKSLTLMLASLFIAATLAVFYLPTIGQAEESTTELTEATEKENNEVANRADTKPSEETIVGDGLRATAREIEVKENGSVFLKGVRTIEQVESTADEKKVLQEIAKLQKRKGDLEAQLSDMQTQFMVLKGRLNEKDQNQPNLELQQLTKEFQVNSGALKKQLTALNEALAEKMETMSQVSTAEESPTEVTESTEVNANKEEPQKKSETKSDEKPQSLSDAVADFNAKAQSNRIGTGQPPLATEEVVAAIRGWIRDQTPASDEVYETYQKIAETQKLPPGAALTFTTGWRGYKKFDFDVWWIDLSISTGPGSSYTFRIRDTKLRSRPSRIKQDQQEPTSDGDWPEILGKPLQKERVIGEQAYQRLGLKLVPTTEMESNQLQPHYAIGLKIVGGNVPKELELPAYLYLLDQQPFGDFNSLRNWMSGQPESETISCTAVANGKEYLFEIQPLSTDSAAATSTVLAHKFPSLEHQKLADLVWKRLGLEMEPIDDDDLKRLKALGYDGGLKVTAAGGAGRQPGDPRTGGMIQAGDILVGLHVWPTTSMQSIAEVLNRDDLLELNPLKFYVVRQYSTGNPPSSKTQDTVITGRVTANIEHLVRAQMLSQAAVAPPPAQKPASKSTNSNLRYDGKSFDEWRDEWQTELSIEKRLEAVKALAAFGARGYAPEATETILDVVAEYDARPLPLDTPEAGLKQAVKEGLITKIPHKVWRPLLRKRFDADPKKWQWLAVATLPNIEHTDDEDRKETQAFLLLLARNEETRISSPAVSALVQLDPALENDEAKQLVMDRLNSDQLHVIQQILSDLGERAPQHPSELIDLLLHGDPQKQMLLRQAFHPSTPYKANLALVDTLTALIKDETKATDHLAAIRALAALGEAGERTKSKPVEVLQGIVNSGNAELQIAAAVAISQITRGQTGDWPLLTGKLRDADGNDLDAAAIQKLIQTEREAIFGKPK